MNSKLSAKDMAGEIKQSLRALRNQLSMLNRQIGARVDLKEVDHDCLDLIARAGAVSPTALAQKARMHPATVTGVLDRLARAGWISRDRTDADRRAVLVSARGDRIGEMVSLYAGMNRHMDDICASYSKAELEVIADFLRRTIDAGRHAAEELEVPSGASLQRAPLDPGRE